MVKIELSEQDIRGIYLWWLENKPTFIDKELRLIFKQARKAGVKL